MQNNQNHTVLTVNNQFAGLRDLNAVAALVVDYFSKRERQARTTHLLRLQTELEHAYKCSINWDELVATFKALMSLQAGSLITGKTADKHRFEWGLSLVDVAKAALGAISAEAIKPTPTGKTRIVYPVGYTPHKRNKDAVRAKRKGTKGRIKGGKNKPVSMLPPPPTPRVTTVPAPTGQGIEVMVIEGDRMKRYEIPADKVSGFCAMMPLIAVAK